MPDDNPFGDLCCESYKSATDFTARLVQGYADRVEDLQVGISYFSSYVNNPQSKLTNAADVIADLNSHTYKGGWTYTGGAFDACREMLMNGKASSTKMLFLITDGNPTVTWEELAGGECLEEPLVEGRCAGGSDCSAASLNCASHNAEKARLDGIEVIPIGIGDVDESNLITWKSNLHYLASNFEELERTVFSSLLAESACEIDFKEVPTAAPTENNCVEEPTLAFTFDSDVEGWVATPQPDPTDPSYYAEFSSSNGGSLQLRGDGDEYSIFEKAGMSLPANCEYLKMEFNYCTSTTGNAGPWESSDHFLVTQVFDDGAGGYLDPTSEQVSKYTGMADSDCGYETQTTRLTVPSGSTEFKVQIEALTSSRFEKLWIQDISFSCCATVPPPTRHLRSRRQLA